MVEKYRAYPESKNSEVEWLGAVPSHWKVKKLKYICNVITGARNTENAVDGGKYPFYVRSQIVERINSVGANCEAVLTAGDGVGVGKVFHYYDGKFDFHQRVYMLNSFSNVLGRFVFYYLSSNFYKVALDGNAKSTVDSLRLPQFLNFEFSLPPIGDQKTIIDFLDYETGRIDGLIEKQRRLIELLKEKRQAVISHAVTKGLNPNAPLRPSGLKWLGDIPAHWEACLIKHKCKEITDGAHTSPVTEGGERYFVSITDVKKGVINFENALLTTVESFEYLTQAGCMPFGGDILFSKDGTIGETAITPKSIEFVVASSLIIIRPLPNKILSSYLDFLLRSGVVKEQVESFVKGAALRRLSIQNLLKIKGLFPPLSEQKEISTYLEKTLERYEELESKALQQIALFKERRTALISAAVTGKIDVRDWDVPDKNNNKKEEAA